MKKKNWARIIWVFALFVLLIVILVMVMNYKIYYQYALKNKLYFYECNDTVCVMEVESDEYLMYSKYDCGDDVCPVYKKNIDDNYLLLTKNDKAILYDYRKGKVISQDYEDYFFINQNYIIVTLSGKQGVINLKNKVTIPLKYNKVGYFQNDYLSGYNLEYIIVQNNDKYGIISYKDGTILEKVEFDEKDIDSLLDKLKE